MRHFLVQISHFSFTLTPRREREEKSSGEKSRFYLIISTPLSRFLFALRIDLDCKVAPFNGVEIFFQLTSRGTRVLIKSKKVGAIFFLTIWRSILLRIKYIFSICCWFRNDSTRKKKDQNLTLPRFFHSPIKNDSLRGKGKVANSSC